MTIELFREYRSHPSRQLRDRIFDYHYRLACEIAHQFKILCHVPFEDLLQLAAMGLITAIERFNPDLGYAFSSFACPYIKGEIYHYLRDKAAVIKIPRSLQSLYQQGSKLRGTDQQIAQTLGVSEDKWREAKEACINGAISIDRILEINSGLETIQEQFQGHENNTHCIKQFICPEALSTHDHNAALSIDLEPIPLVLDNLDQTTRTLLEMLFLEGQPLKEVRKTAIASGIKAREIKPLLVNAISQLSF